MNDFIETNAENLRFLRGSKGLNQSELGAIIGLNGYHISQIETGRRALSDSEKKLFDLYFFGTMPEGIVRSSDSLSSIVSLTPDEWRIIEILADRAGKSAQNWIRDKIRDYLAFNEEARREALGPQLNFEQEDQKKQA